MSTFFQFASSQKAAVCEGGGAFSSGGMIFRSSIGGASNIMGSVLAMMSSLAREAADADELAEGVAPVASGVGVLLCWTSGWTSRWTVSATKATSTTPPTIIGTRYFETNLDMVRTPSRSVGDPRDADRQHGKSQGEEPSPF